MYRKSTAVLCFFFLSLTAHAADIPGFLRQGVDVTPDQIAAAVDMYNQGWRYTMPTPRSTQAEWGNTDQRTKWNEGGWKNEATGACSYNTPRKDTKGKYIGDGKNTIGSERQGSPGRPDVYMFLLSRSGGPHGGARSAADFEDILN